MAHIQLDNVGLTFHVRRGGRVGLKEFLVRGMFRRSAENWLTVEALRDINLQIRQGERVGVIGKNGAGKTSLLKLLAGVYPPTSGRRGVEGSVSSLFEITLGFEPDASGWENIKYRGYLQGESPRSIRAKAQSIADFCELGDFLNMPVRYYSTGMTVRLAFAIATAVEPQILLVDESLSAGDLAFQKRARRRMKKLMSEASLVVLVSHDLEAVSNVCDRVILLDGGRIRQDGPADEVIATYQQGFATAHGKAA